MCIQDTFGTILKKSVNKMKVKKTALKRRRFQPGNKEGKKFEKGNKAAVGKGRPKRIPSLDAILTDILGTDSPDDSKSAIHKIIKALTRKAQFGDAKAATLLMDRWQGKAKQYIEVDTVSRKASSDLFPKK